MRGMRSRNRSSELPNGRASRTATMSRRRCVTRALPDYVDQCIGPTVAGKRSRFDVRSEEHTSELQSRSDLVCRLLLEKKKNLCRTILQTNSPIRPPLFIIPALHHAPERARLETETGNGHSS